MYFVMAVFTPKSRKRIMVVDGINAIAYNPYSSGEISLIKTTVPIASIMVDRTVPAKSWKLAVAETLPIFNAFSDDSMPTDCVNSNASFSRQYPANTDLESLAVFRLLRACTCAGQTSAPIWRSSRTRCRSRYSKSESFESVSQDGFKPDR